MKVVSGLVAIFITLPIWFYLVHYILVKVGAGDLEMFLFWVYVPFTIFINVVAKLTEKA